MDEQKLIEAAVEHLKEDQSRAFYFAVRECVKLANPLVPMEQIQVAAAIVSQAARQLLTQSWSEPEDKAVGQKLQAIMRQLDNLANSL